MRRVSIAENGKEIKPVLSLLTDLGDALALFVCNTSSSFTDSDNQRNQEKTRSRKLEFPGAEITVFSPERGFVRELDPRTGLVHSVNFTYSNGAYRFSTPMERFASRLYIITDKKLSEVRPAVSHEKASGMSVGLPAVGLEFEVDEDNVIVLDHASYKIANRESDGEEFVLEIDDKIRDAIGCQHRGGHMCQPWTRRNEPDGIAVPVSLAFKFKCAVLPASDCFLALEMADSFAVEINGRRIEKKNCGFWMDPCLVKIPVPRDCIVRGENKIVISGKYNRKMTGMEAMFLIGRFGVDAAGCMVAYPKSISIGDWVPQGLPNYTGNLTYRIPLPEIPAGSRAVVRVPRWRGAALEIGVNDGEKTLVPWSPYELDISGKTGAGANTLEITVYGNRRNACGPFYFKNTAEEGWYGPGQMRRHDFAERELVMMGILKQVELIIR